MNITIGNKIFTNVESVEMALELGATEQEVNNAKDQELVQEVRFIAERIREIGVNSASRLKVNGWLAKTPSALRIVSGSGDAFDRDLISKEAEISGISTLDQAIRIKHKASQLAVLNSAVEGFEEKAVDLIKAGYRSKIQDRIEKAKITLNAQTQETIGSWLQEASLGV